MEREQRASSGGAYLLDAESVRGRDHLSRQGLGGLQAFGQLLVDEMER